MAIGHLLLMCLPTLIGSHLAAFMVGRLYGSRWAFRVVKALMFRGRE